MGIVYRFIEIGLVGNRSCVSNRFKIIRHVYRFIEIGLVGNGREVMMHLGRSVFVYRFIEIGLVGNPNTLGIGLKLLLNSLPIH